MRFPSIVFALLVLLSGTAAAETLYLKGSLTAGEHPLLNDLLIRPSSRLTTRTLPDKIDTENSVTYLSQKSVSSFLDDDLKGSLVGEGVWIFPSGENDISESLADTPDNWDKISSELMAHADSFSIPLDEWNQLQTEFRSGVWIVSARLLPNEILRLTLEEKAGTFKRQSYSNIPVKINPLAGSRAHVEVRAGTLVNVLIYRQGILISAPGRVNSTAGLGEITRIRLNGTGRLMDARITGADSAEALFQ